MSKNANNEIDYYRDLFSEHVRECVRWRDHEQDEPFLLNARKALEAALYAVSAAKGLKNTANTSIHDALKNTALIDKTTAAKFELIRLHSNKSAHVQNYASQEEETSKKDKQNVSSFLHDAARWLYQNLKKHHEQRLIPTELPKDLEGSLQRLVADVEIPAPRVIDASEWAEREAMIRKYKTHLEVLDNPLSAVLIEPRLSTSTTPPPTLSRLFFVGVFLALAFGAAIGAGAATWIVRSTPARAEHLPSAATPTGAADTPAAPGVGVPAAPIDIAATPPSESSAHPSPSDTAALPAAQPTCPEGMVLLSGGPLTLGQPLGGRQDWPPASPRRLAPLEVQAFCVDRAPVSRASLDAWRRAERRPASPRCSGAGRAEAPADCVDDEEAVAYCASRNARLPHIAEWERIARANLLATALELPEEWVSDTFPPAVFGRHGCSANSVRCNHRMIRGLRIPDPRLPREPNVRYSWNAPNAQALVRPALGFRCAASPSE
jgi:formylglycine-generating enzyme required for sulfatase activity